MDTPIVDFIKEYASSGTSRFHMPGHKGDREISSCASYDITEIAGADSLYEASGIIAGSEANASALFGSEATFHSVEGSSQCIRAMLALVTEFGEPSGMAVGELRGRTADDHEESRGRPVILAARNVHRSFLTAAALLDLDVQWLYPEDEEYSLTSCRISAERVREKLAEMPVKPAAVYITSPDYLGGMQDVSGIAAAAHEAGVPLLVDNAHGAYLHFLENPVHPLDQGADMCCDSAHKTLPALTGCAYLHINKEAVRRDIYIDNARRALALFGSTSPSYLLLKSLDETNTVLAGSFREDLKVCCGRVRDCKAKLKEQGWILHDGEEPLKITIDAGAGGLTGGELAGQLRENSVECEYADPDYVVFMASPYNKPEDFEKLISAAFAASGMIRKSERVILSAPKPEKVLSIREAMFSPGRVVSALESIGMVLADTALTCPPAVPLIICGERIPEGAEKIFEKYGTDKLNVIIE